MRLKGLVSRRGRPGRDRARSRFGAAGQNLQKAYDRTAHFKRHVARHWHGYGFLPGYPPRIAWEDPVAAWQRGPAYWPG